MAGVLVDGLILLLLLVKSSLLYEYSLLLIYRRGCREESLTTDVSIVIYIKLAYLLLALKITIACLIADQVVLLDSLLFINAERSGVILIRARVLHGHLILLLYINLHVLYLLIVHILLFIVTFFLLLLQLLYAFNTLGLSANAALTAICSSCFNQTWAIVLHTK